MDKLLRCPLTETGLSISFCERAALMGFASLEDILMLGPAELLQKEYADTAWLLELTDFLSARKLLHLLQPTPGKTPL